jgi:hypothetical protein
MALFDDILNGGNLATGVLVGVGALIGWLLLSPIARPASKSMIKAGLIAYQQADQRAEQLYAGAVEGIGDMVAEAQQEIGATTAAQSYGDGSLSRAT